jgi:hypothetical protein
MGLSDRVPSVAIELDLLRRHGIASKAWLSLPRLVNEPFPRRARTPGQSHVLWYPLPRRGVRVVDGAALEKRCAKAPRVRIPPSPPPLGPRTDDLAQLTLVLEWAVDRFPVQVAGTLFRAGEVA